MGKKEKLLKKILSGQSDYNTSYQDIANLLIYLGFKVRKEGSHNIFTKDGVLDRINLQSVGGKAKGYQVKQIRKILTYYKFNIFEDNE